MNDLGQAGNRPFRVDHALRQPSGLVVNRVKKAKTDGKPRRQIHGQVKTGDRARENVHGQSNPWATDGLARFFVDHDDVNPCVIDLDHLQGTRCAVMAWNRLRGGDRVLVMAAKRLRSQVEFREPCLDGAPARRRQTFLDAEQADFVDDPSKCRAFGRQI